MSVLRRSDIEQDEARRLAPFALKASESKGRKFPENESPERTCYQRDHDRIIHSKAFRRMQYKTQVFVYAEGDHYRTRLTHTMEVAQVCRSIARMLGLNVDLAETVALAHDLGHPPFGHAGEDALNDLLGPFGGFNHNEQTLRVVDYLESRYPDFPGLNLTYEVREGIAKHESKGAHFDVDEFPPSIGPSLEAAIVDLADEIAYNSHDIDDGLASELFTLDDIRGVALCDELLRESELARKEISDRLRRYDLIRRMVSKQIIDLSSHIDSGLSERKIYSEAEARGASREIVRFSHPVRTQLDELRKFLTERLYKHPKVARMANEGKDTVRRLYTALTSNPLQLPDVFKSRLDDDPVELIVRDYIAGMTDRYAEESLKRISA